MNKIWNDCPICGNELIQNNMYVNNVFCGETPSQSHYEIMYDLFDKLVEEAYFFNYAYDEAIINYEYHSYSVFRRENFTRIFMPLKKGNIYISFVLNYSSFSSKEKLDKLISLL